LEARLLRQMVNRDVHALYCAESCRWKYQRGLLLGDLCASSGHPWWAIRVWRLALSLILTKDYDDWRYVWTNTEWINIDYVLSEEESLVLARRIDDMWRRLGHPEEVHMEVHATCEYDWFWLEKYDYDRHEIFEFEAEVRDYEQRKATEELFHTVLFG
jgi:hypothetical protein